MTLSEILRGRHIQLSRSISIIYGPGLGEVRLQWSEMARSLPRRFGTIEAYIAKRAADGEPLYMELHAFYVAKRLGGE